LTRYFVTRHQGAKDLARRWNLDCRFVEHLTPEQLRPGDEVIGVLPVHLAAECLRRGARYYHLALNVPEGERLGRAAAAYSADEMLKFGARLVPYWIEPTGEPAPAPALEPPPGLLWWLRLSLRGAAKRLRRIEERCPKGLALIYGAFLLAICPGGVADAIVELRKDGASAVALGLAASGAWIGGLMVLSTLVDRRRFIYAVTRSLTPWIAAKLRDSREPAVVSSVALITGGASMAVAMSLLGSLPTEATWLAVWLTVFAVVATLAARLGAGVLDVTVEEKIARHEESRRIVIMTLSHLTKTQPSREVIDIGAERAASEETRHPHVRNLVRALEGGAAFDLGRACDTEAFEEPYFLWQQNMRVLAENFLRRQGQLLNGEVIVITSEESDGQFEAFRELTETLAKRSGLTLSISRRGPVDYFDLGKIEEAFRGAIHDSVGRADDPAGYGDILIDVTAGPKLVSIAGAAVTMSSEMLFAYAETGQANKVRVLDARVRIGKTPG
jgi:CRISPR-associated protein Csx16